MNSLQSIIAITGSHSLVIFHLAQNGTKEASDTRVLGPLSLPSLEQASKKERANPNKLFLQKPLSWVTCSLRATYIDHVKHAHCIIWLNKCNQFQIGQAEPCVAVGSAVRSLWAWLGLSSSKEELHTVCSIQWTFIHSFNRYLFSVHHVRGTGQVLGMKWGMRFMCLGFGLSPQ